MKLKLPATTANLGPGFDCLGAALSLYNEFEVKVLNDNTKKVEIFTEGIDAELIPKDETNHFYYALKKVFEITKNKLLSLEIYIKNNIPLQRGLGSSATAYVGGLVAGNILCGEVLSEYELVNLAAELEGHPDNVVPCMFGGFCITTKIDKKVKFIKFPAPKDLSVLVIIPDKKISTEYARKVLPKKIGFNDAVSNVSNVALLVGSILSKKYEFLRYATVDFLHQPYRKKLMPWMESVFRICLENKSLGCVLSGSGSTIAAFYRKKDINENLLDSVQLKLKKYINCEIKILSFVNKGVITKE
ncbi:MAG: homoserine kinase [Elusimicrobiota bacterium]|nr:homoserine kinase [Endomicrobiia bacterium]MDW8165220.1 homoserine kinase [Elusimicrobiota bacterium]